MPVNDSICILETGTDVRQYRIAHLVDVKACWWDRKRECHTDDPDVIIENARDMWGSCFAYSTLELAAVVAVKLAEKHPDLGHDVVFISIPREFEKYVDQVAEG